MSDVPTGYSLSRDEEGLTDNERRVLALREEKKPYQAIGDEMGISRQRVGQIVKSLRAKGKLPA